MNGGERRKNGPDGTAQEGGGLNLRPFRAANAPASDAPSGPAAAQGPSLEELRELIGDAAAIDEEGFATPLVKEDKPELALPDEEPSGQGSPAVTVKEVRRRELRRKRAMTEREKRLREKRKRALKLLAGAIAGVVFLAAGLLTYFLLIVDFIEVHGAERFTGEQILEASNLKIGRHIWLNRTGEAERLIEENPYVASAVVTRVYPDKLVINTVERTEAAVLVGMNAQAVIDSEGYVLSIGARADYAGLIRVSGMGSGGYHVNQRLGEESYFNSRTLVALLAAVYGAGMEGEIESIDMSNPLSVNLYASSGLTIHLGQPDAAAEKLAAFKTVLPTLRLNGLDTAGTLDLSAKGDPVYSPQSVAPVTGDPGGPKPDGSPIPDASPRPNTGDPNTGDPNLGSNPQPTEGFSG